MGPCKHSNPEAEVIETRYFVENRYTFVTGKVSG